jgi:hypothetical protein
MSRADAPYGGGPGENSEELVKELLQESDWSVKELRKASDDGYAPMLEGTDLRLVDFQVHDAERRTRYIEVKSKKEAVYFGVEDEHRHGWEQAQHSDYIRFSREFTEDPVYVFVHERDTGVILRQRLRNLSPVQRIDDEAKLAAYNSDEPMVVFARDDFEIVTDDVSQYFAGFGQTGIVKEDIDICPFGDDSRDQFGLSDFGGDD